MKAEKQEYHRESVDADEYEDVWAKIEARGNCIDGTTTFLEFTDVYDVDGKIYECLWFSCNVNSLPHHIYLCTPIEHPQLELFPK